jgi:NAD(P)-dependent dehydrogenase (short-subunit alcohol dehydrogenase family)
MDNSTLLGGQTIIVKGAARGLGEAIARALGSHGANLVLVDVDPLVLQVSDQLGARSIAVAASIAEQESAEQVLESALQNFGGVTGLINNAGVIQERPFWEESPESLRRIVESNVLGSMYFGSAIAKYFVSVGGGRIVNLTSGAAAGYKHYSSYGATKGALTALTYGWALDGFEVGIDVNAIAPVARTYMATFTERQRRLTRNPPPPEAIAPIAVYLMSPQAAGITGQVFRVTETEISLVSSPRAKQPTLTNAGWDQASLAHAVDQLRDHFEAVGNRGWIPPTMAMDLPSRAGFIPEA